MDVGYRYYDKHPEEICYPFGHGLSYSDFIYRNLQVHEEDEHILLSMQIENTGKYDGEEVIQLYVGREIFTVPSSIKELKAFRKVFIRCGEVVDVHFKISKQELSYYNTMLGMWIVESGKYRFYLGSSSRDIRLEKTIKIKGNQPYSMLPNGKDMIG